MKLNVGCGDRHLEGYINIDLRDDVADVVADIRSLPYDDGVAEEIRAEDILEHFPADQTMTLLAEWNRVLTPGGTLILKVPNLMGLADCLIRSNEAKDFGFVRLLIRNIYGGHRWGPEGAWDAHHWGFTLETLTRDLDAAGFEVVAHNDDLNMTVEAKKR